MGDERKKSRWGPWAAVALLAVPMYVLSLGPALVLWEQGWLRADAVRTVWGPARAALGDQVWTYGSCWLNETAFDQFWGLRSTIRLDP